MYPIESHEIYKCHIIIDYMPPVIIIGQETFLVTVGEKNTYTFLVADGFSVTVDGGIPLGGVIFQDGHGNYTFEWTLMAIPTGPLSFVATSSLGHTVFHIPVLQVCACLNDGQCVVAVPTKQSIHILSCVCTEGMYYDLTGNPHSCLVMCIINCDLTYAQLMMESTAMRIEMAVWMLNVSWEWSAMMFLLLGLE